jgi:hypothetical protein
MPRTQAGERLEPQPEVSIVALLVVIAVVAVTVFAVAFALSAARLGAEADRRAGRHVADVAP